MRPHFVLGLFWLSIFMLSQAGVLVRWSNLPVDAIGFWRMTITLPILFVWAWRAGYLKIDHFNNIGTWIRVASCAVILYAHWRLWFMAIELTTVANATVCFALSPLFTALGALVFFREPITMRLAIAITLGLSGLAVMVWGNGASTTSIGREGDLIGLISVACFSGYILLGKSLRSRLPNLIFTLCTYSLVGVGFAISMFLTETAWVGYPTKSWIALVSLALGPTLLGHAAFTYCLSFLNVNFMTCATLMEPIFAAIASAWLFNEPVKPATIVAFVLVSSGVLILYAKSLNFRVR